MDDMLLSAVATELAKGALVASVNSAWKSLVELVRNRFKKDDSASKALELAKQDPDDAGTIHTLQAVLAKHATRDPEFYAELKRLWNQNLQELSVSRGGVANQVSGSFVKGPVVQMRDVKGGIRFGSDL